MERIRARLVLKITLLEKAIKGKVHDSDIILETIKRRVAEVMNKRRKAKP